MIGKVIKIILFILLFLLYGCFGIRNYRSVESGERAKLNFVSEKIKDNLFMIDEVSLIVYELNNTKFHAKGKIVLNPSELKKTVFVPANEILYLKVQYLSSTPGGNKSTRSYKFFRFLPKDGREYSIEYVQIYNAAFEIMVNEINSKGEKIKIKVFKW